MFAVGINISHGKRTGLSSLITIDHERSRERLEGRRYRHDSILPVSRVLRQRAGRGARAHLAHAHRCISVPSQDHVTHVTHTHTHGFVTRPSGSLINRYNRRGSNAGRCGARQGVYLAAVRFSVDDDDDDGDAASNRNPDR